MRSLVGFIFLCGGFAQTPSPVAAPLKDQAWSIITDALHDKNPDTRVQAVQAMGLIGVHEPSLLEWVMRYSHSGEGRLFQLRHLPVAQNPLFQLPKKTSVTGPRTCGYIKKR